MLYSKFIYHAKEKTIQQLENGTWYLEPEWRDIIGREMEIEDLSELEDSYISDWWDVENILRLEADKRNAQNSKKEDVINWLYDLITQSIDPAMLEEETEYLKNYIEYKKVNKEAAQAE